MPKLNKTISWLILAVVILVAVVYVAWVWRQTLVDIIFPSSGFSGEAGVTVETVPRSSRDDIAVVAENLNIPWEVVALPDGSLLVTERPGNFLHIAADRAATPIAGVAHVGEGGLQGLALHPDFVNNNFVYLYLTTRAGDALINRVERYKLFNGGLYDRMVIIDNLPGAQYHDGGRLAFGPDGKLYITVGDANQANRAPDLDYLGGKILRLNADGSVPADNPFSGSPVYSFGHRNPQGLAWDDAGQLWATEHGRSFPLSGLDELNRIEAGKNYGWPVIEGDEQQAELVGPTVHSGTDTTWAPAGLVYLNGSLFFAGLRGEALYQYNISAGQITTHFFKEFGRLRAVALGPDGTLYLSTSNTDGRGTPQPGDDKIIKINPEIFE